MLWDVLLRHVKGRLAPKLPSPLQWGTQGDPPKNLRVNLPHMKNVTFAGEATTTILSRKGDLLIIMITILIVIIIVMSIIVIIIVMSIIVIIIVMIIIVIIVIVIMIIIVIIGIIIIMIIDCHCAIWRCFETCAPKIISDFKRNPEVLLLDPAMNRNISIHKIRFRNCSARWGPPDMVVGL